MKELSEMQIRDLIRDLLLDKVQGPLSGKASIDKPWLKHYPESAILDDLPEQSIYEYLVACISDEIIVFWLIILEEKLQLKRF